MKAKLTRRPVSIFIYVDIQETIKIHCIFLFSGDGLNKIFFPIFTPIGVVGNILSFLVRFLNVHLLNNMIPPI